MAFTLGSDPFASGLPQSTLAANAPTIFGYQLPTIPNPFDLIPNNPVSSAIDTVSSAASGTATFFSEITSADFWERVGLALLGLIFITVALVLMGSKTAIAVKEAVTP